jgi:hypothetical protein
MDEAVRHHPALGELRWDAARHSWETDLDLFPGCPIHFAIVAEDEWEDVEPAELFEIGTAFLAWAREFEPQCRERVADDLLDLFNQSWADDDPEEGPPTHTRAEFLAAIRLSDLTLYPGGASHWYYDPGDLFAGHRIWLMVDADRSFRGKASLVG